MKTLKKIQEENIDWKKELALADAATKDIKPKQKGSGNNDDSPLMHDKTVGLYKAEPSRNVMSELDVQNRANYYIKQYQEAGYAVTNMHKNADGSYGFTTTKNGKVKDHTFHKSGGKQVVQMGDVKDTDDRADDDNEKITKTQDDTQVKRGRPAGALGAGNKADAGMSGRSLQDILMGKINQKMPAGKKRVVKFKESVEEKSDELGEMSMATAFTPAGKKVSWISHPGIGHSVSIDDEPAHQGFLDSKSAAALYAKHTKT